MLLHAMISWPEIIKEDLWPYAVHLTINIHNAMPGISSLTPEEIFSGSKG
jgi:hypothetical protein